MKKSRAAAQLEEKTASILEQGGIISEHLPHFESRPEQLCMATAVARAIETGRHLVVEAGTGVGKSLAYLVPLILFSVENEKKVVVSTYTRTLQNQLTVKDLPFLQNALGIPFEYALCMGSENYICLRRLTSSYTYEIIDTVAQRTEMKRIVEWSKYTGSGLRSDLDFVPRDNVWEHVSRDPDLCLGRKCPRKDDCFYKQAKAQEKKAHILVANHSLFFTNLASGGQVLPNFHAVVFDEAHTLENVATDYLGFEVSNMRIAYLLNSIYNPRTKKGLLVRTRSADATTTERIEMQLAEARAASAKFFDEVARIFGKESDTKRIRTQNIVFNFLEEPLKRLSYSLSQLLDFVDDDELIAVIKSYMRRCGAVLESLKFILKQPKDDYVYWIDIQKRRRTRYALMAAPVEIAGEMKRQVFGSIQPVILTSATLSTNDTFDFIEKRLGIDACDTELLSSPFDYEENVLLYLPRLIEDPTDRFEAFQKQALEYIRKIIDIMKGRIFVLFTSYKMLNAIYDKLTESHPDINLLRQRDKPRYMLLEDFKKDENAVLLGTTTFWQGVDVPGRSLECVIITKLPFAVPDDPITEARIELINSRGGNAFTEYQTPQAIMMFKQGFGRLIRTKSDRGVVAVLDPRIRTRFYGRSFISALPRCRHTFDLEEIETFFSSFLE